MAADIDLYAINLVDGVPLESLMMSLSFALILDALAGEPDWLWRRLPHPAVLLGRLVGYLDTHLNQGDKRRAKGVVALAILIGIALLVGWFISALPLQPLPEIIAAAIFLAQRSLADHVAAVATGLDESIQAGRAAVAHIVGRDTAAMDQPAIARAAIESGAENFSDGIVAPVFWFAVAGLPGMLAYKAINTADSMIGYKTEKHEAFGWAAARLDDLVNLPASRSSALLITVCTFSLAPLRAALRDARLHRSPNAGWPEAAMAASIGVALAGPRVYHGAQTGDPFVYAEGKHDIGAAEVRDAIRVLWRAWTVLLCASFFIAML